MTIKYGLIGGGAWGRCYAEAIRRSPGLELVGIAEVSDESVAVLKNTMPDVPIIKDYRELLAKEFDIAAVVLPNHLHHEVGLAALESGKHLLIEKPFALTVAQCDDIIRLAKEKNRSLVVGHQFRLSSLWGKIKEMIDAGFVGEPKYSLIELSRNPYRFGVDGWRFDRERVGNWISEEPIHFLDLACWYFEKYSKPLSLRASANATDPNRSELQDNIGATIDFSDGSFAVVAQTLSAFEHHQSVKIAGSKGALWGGWSGALDRTLHPTFFLKAFDGREVRDVTIEKITGELFELEDQVKLMAEIIQGKAAIHCTGQEGRLAVELSLATLEAAAQKKTILFTGYW